MVTRIRKLLEQKQLTPTQFADLIGVGRPVMSHILSERNKPSLEVVQRIISAFPELSIPWLLSGTGEMLATPETPASASQSVATTPEASAPAEVASATQSPATTAPVLPEIAVLPASAAPLASRIAPAIPQEVSEPVSPAVAPAMAAAPSSPAAVPKPFRATRFVPVPAVAPAPPLAAAAALALTTAPAAVALPPEPLPVPAQAKAAAADQLPGAVPDAAMLPFLADSGKAIRRIVIFYRDGSFADYQPEQ